MPSQLKLGLESFFRSVIPQRNTQLTADVLHQIIFRKNAADEPLQALRATDRN
jgi:hypothetical protein